MTDTAPHDDAPERALRARVSDARRDTRQRLDPTPAPLDGARARLQRRHRLTAAGVAAAVVIVVAVAGVVGTRSGGTGADTVVADSGRSQESGLPDSPADPIPTSAEDMAVAGSPIANGFSVPAGSVLAGGPLAFITALSDGGAPTPDGGWEAHLVVPGDPRAVLGDLRRQARAVGLDVRPAMDSAVEVPQSFCRRDGAVYECFAAGGSEPFDGRYLTIEVHRRPRDGDIGPESYALVTYSDSEQQAIGLEQFLALGPADAPLGPAPPPVPLDWSALPATGQPFAVGYHGGELDPLILEDGSRLIVPTTLGTILGCTNRSFAALLAVEGDGREVVEAYAQQVSSGPGRTADSSLPGPGPVTVDGPRGSRITVRNAMTRVGVSFSFQLVERSDGPALLQITSCQG